MNNETEIQVPNTAFDDRRRRRRAIGGAAAVGGVAGLVLVGPIVALAAAGGAAALAASNRKDNKAVQAAQVTGGAVASVGSAAVSVGSSVRNFEQNHQIGQKTSNGIRGASNWVSQKFNRQSTTSSSSTETDALNPPKTGGPSWTSI